MEDRDDDSCCTCCDNPAGCCNTAIRPAIVELICTCFIVFIGCGVWMSLSDYRQPGAQILAVALAFGTSTMAATYLSWDVTQSHFNPAVTLAALITGNLKPAKATMYITGQALGALLAVLLLWCVSPSGWNDACFGAPMLSSTINVTLGQGFVAEMVSIAFVVLVYCQAWDIENNNNDGKSAIRATPLSLGTIVFVVHMMTAPTTGCGLSPFRSFAAALAASPIEGCGEVWTDHYMYWIAPPVGATLAAILHRFVIRTPAHLLNN